MLEQKDLEAIAALIDARATKTEEKIEERVTRAENFILEEIDRLDQKVELVKKNLEELEQYYKITKLENDNTKILLQLIEGLRNDVEELKKRTA